MGILENIKSPLDIKGLTEKQLDTLSEEIRQKLIEITQNNGGHLASNLGVVELTLALHYVFDCPNDKLIWDVGHQCYTHKLITGRSIDNIRKSPDISGFPKMSESEYDCFGTGHSSTALSAAAGFAEARKITGKDYEVVAVVGDAALTGGMSFEALNNIGASSQKMLIVLNDNKMSISKNVGALSRYLSKVRLNRGYLGIKRGAKKVFDKIPLVGKGLRGLKAQLKFAFLRNRLFEQLGIKYIGPIDGHNTQDLIDIFSRVKNQKKPVLVHVITKKGKGHSMAEQMPEKYHGISGANESKEISFSQAAGDALCELAKEDKNVVAITAAMPDGTGLKRFSTEFKDRFFDVGIAEAHATTFCASLAASGLKPYFAVYSSFLQRGYDQIIHDVALQNLPVRFLIDRAGLVGADGATHQGMFDLSYLGHIPNLRILCPKDSIELSDMIKWSAGVDFPLAIRYPKGFYKNFDCHTPIQYAKWERLSAASKNNCILALGPRMVEQALLVAEQLDCEVVNARFVKPLDEEYLKNISALHIITLEENAQSGGFGNSIINYYNLINDKRSITCLSLGNDFIGLGEISEQLQDFDLSSSKIIQKIDEKQ